MSDVTEYQLVQPIEFGKELVTELSLRAPRAKDMRAFDQVGTDGRGGISAIIDFLASCSGRPPRLIEQMGAEDFMALQDWVGKFVPDGPATGVKPSGTSPTPPGGVGAISIG